MEQTPRIKFFRDRHGHSIAYAEHGEGPLVICPAWWVSHVEDDWNSSVYRRFFERVGSGFRLVRYDRVGVGLSDRNTVSRTLDDEADLLEDLIQTIGEPRYALLAISCGGPIAVRHAVRFPESVDKICFYGSFANGQDTSPTDIQEAVRAIVRAHWGLGSRALADIFFPDATREEIAAIAKQSRKATNAETAEELLRLSYSMDVRDNLDQVTADCLVLHRSGDRAIPFEAGRQLAARLTNAQLISLKGRSHPPWMDGDEIAHLANAFLTGADVASSTEVSQTEDAAACSFDEHNKCLVVAGKQIALTPREFSVLRELTSAEAKVVSRDELLERVWNQAYEGSNRIDAVISSLRKKLGRWSPSIETVTGHGYRFTQWAQQDAPADDPKAP